MAKRQNLYETVLEQVTTACNKMKVDNAVCELLKEPMRTMMVSFPVRMDDDSIRMFNGFRCQHNDVLGPTKGGIRFHPQVDMNEVKSLAAWMTYKCSLLGLPYGGGKGGIEVDPRTLSKGELERLSRAFIRAIAPIIGDHKDIPAPDVNTNPQIIAWMGDEFSKLRGYNEPGFITGKPVIVGGSLGRTEATGYGVALAAKMGAAKIGLDLNGAKVVVQGFGNVGSYAAKFMASFGAKVVAVADYTAVVYNENGLDIDALCQYVDTHDHVVKGFPGATKEMTPESWLDIQCDILIPAALENQITEENAHKVTAKLISEGANGPTTPEADEILYKKGVVVIPDILANAGGVTVSYFEWVQNLQNFYWSQEEVIQRLETMMTKAFEGVWSLYKSEGDCPMRVAAYMVSIRRLADAMKVRGWF